MGLHYSNRNKRASCMCKQHRGSPQKLIQCICRATLTGETCGTLGRAKAQADFAHIVSPRFCGTVSHS